MPDRQREINSLAGIESNVAGPTLGDGDSSSDEDKPVGEDGEADGQPNKAAKKGDVDSSSDEEGASEELSDSDDEDEKVVDAKKGTSKAVAKKSANPKEAKKIQKKVLTKADKQAKNDKIKRDLKKEQQELGKMLMTNRQKKMYQEVEK